MQIDGRTYSLKRSPPPDRTVEQLWNHFQIERAIANRIKASAPEARKAIYATMYDELFARVPDHPRLTRRRSQTLTDAANVSRLAMLAPWLKPDSVVAEFACGDARFSMESLAPRVRQVYGIDISDQRGEGVRSPTNFSMVTYDGFRLEGVPDGSVDVVFSDQFLEHLHPDEIANHFDIVWRMLKVGGVYVIRTPHALTGPHDISMYFTDEPEGFHLHEWRFVELRDSLARTRFTGFTGFWNARNRCIPLPTWWLAAVEGLLGTVPRATARRMSRYLLPTLMCAARK